MKQIAIGADHAGFELKEKIKDFLKTKDYAVVDCGTFSKDAVDYPAIALKVARAVADGSCEKGIMVDGAGIGSAMAANKVPGVRAALCYDLSTAKNSREHNDANVLTLGAGLIGFELAKQIIDTWLTTACTVDRHLRRVKMIEDIEKGTMNVNASSKPDSELSIALISDTDLQKIAAKISAMMGHSLHEIAAACSDESCNGCGQCVEKAPAAVQKFVSMGATRFSNAMGGIRPPKSIAQYIDHTLLKPDASSEAVKKLCQEAVENQFASVCINPSYVKMAHDLTIGSTVKVCSVVGFPLGACVPEIKAMEARRAIRDGAKEIDMVINVGALKSGNDQLVFKDIRGVVDACVDGSAICKVIIEAALLNDDEKIRACELSKKARAHYVKTSTGFGPGGATVHDVELMSRVVSGTSMGVKAAGGIRNYEDVQKMIAAGATRIGASAGVKIVQEAGNAKKS